MDTQLLIVLSDGIKTYPGQLIAALVIMVFVGWAKNAPVLKNLLTTVARKRIFALIVSVLPVFAIVLYGTKSWAAASCAAVLAFFSATGINRIMPNGSSNTDAIAVAEEVGKILASKKEETVPEKVEEPKKEVVPTTTEEPKEETKEEN